MIIADLQHLLDRYGGDPNGWPPPQRAAAERLIAVDPEARALAERTRMLDAAIAASLQAADTGGARVMAALTAQKLPRQRGSRWAWPAALLTVDFTPAWSRVTALAGVAALGFALGLAGLDLTEGASSSAAAASDAGLSVAALEPETLTGVRP